MEHIRPAAGRLEIADERYQVTASIKCLDQTVELHFDVAAGPVRREARSAVVDQVFRTSTCVRSAATHPAASRTT